MADNAVRMQRVSSEVEKEQEGLRTTLLKDANHSRYEVGSNLGEIPYLNHTRVLGELAEKEAANVTALSKRDRETQFLEQKSNQYSKTIESLKVQCAHIWV